MMRLIPPIAVPAGPADIAASVARASASGSEALKARLAAHCGFETAELLGSGRAALAAYLRAIAPRGATVIVPAYTCYSVPAAVVRAGLRVRIVDVSPGTLAIEPDSVEAAADGSTAAVIVPHMFARTGDVAAVVRAARAGNAAIRVIEDAAQALTSTRAEGVDALLLSFGRGKPLALGGGGAVLHEGSPIAGGRTAGGGWGRAASLAATTVLSRPLWFRIPESIPALGIGETVYDPSFPIDSPFFEWQAALGLRALERFASEERRRSEHARRLLAAVDATPGWTVPAPAHADGPIRLPLLAPDRRERDRVLAELRRLGVRASRMYPGTLADIEALRPHLVNPDTAIPGARAIADRLITLPIYPTLSPSDLERVAIAFRAAAGRGVA